MATGSDTFMANGVPLYPNKGFNIKQQVSGTDIVTVTALATAQGSVPLAIVRPSGPTASAIEVRDNAGTAGWAVSKNYGIKWKVRTTRPTTGLTKGEMFIAFHGSSPKICICTSTAGQTVKQVRAKTKTFGRLTA
jgi:hypothetical protein